MSLKKENCTLLLFQTKDKALIVPTKWKSAFECELQWTAVFRAVGKTIKQSGGRCKCGFVHDCCSTNRYSSTCALNTCWNERCKYILDDSLREFSCFVLGSRVACVGAFSDVLRPRSPGLGQRKNTHTHTHTHTHTQERERKPGDIDISKGDEAMLPTWEMITYPPLYETSSLPQEKNQNQGMGGSW